MQVLKAAWDSHKEPNHATRSPSLAQAFRAARLPIRLRNLEHGVKAMPWLCIVQRKEKQNMCIHACSTHAYSPFKVRHRFDCPVGRAEGVKVFSRISNCGLER